MLQVRKSRFCGISAIVFPVLMTVSNSVYFFLGIISWKGALLFNDGGWGNWGWYWFRLRRFSKKSWHGGTPHPHHAPSNYTKPQIQWLMDPSYVRNSHWVLAQAMTFYTIFPKFLKIYYIYIYIYVYIYIYDILYNVYHIKICLYIYVAP